MGVIRKTKSVIALQNEFSNSSSAAISVVTLIKNLGSKFNKTTIYRVLDKLEADGILHSFLGKNGLKWYAKCNGCSANKHQDLHPHFQCIDCGKVDCLDVSVVLPEIPNREIVISQLLIQGKCHECLI